MKRSAGGVLHKNRSHFETPFDDLASGTEIALVKKLLLQGLVKRGSRGGLADPWGLEEMFRPRSPDLKVHLIY